MKDVQASDIRPLSILEDTLEYLMKLLDSSDQSFLVLHDFIFDNYITTPKHLVHPKQTLNNIHQFFPLIQSCPTHQNP